MSTFGSRPPTTASEFGSQEKLRYTAQYDPEPNSSSYAPGEVPLAPSKGVDAVAPGIKGRPLPTSANPLSYEDTVLIDQNSITVWSHRHTNFQRKLVLPLRGATFIAVNYRRFYRDPFLKFHYWGIDDGIFYLYYPAHTIYFLFSLLSSILAFLAAGFQSFSIQIAAWVISLLTIIIGFLAFYNFVNLRERKFKNTLPARITFFVSFAFHFACFVALTHAFRLQMGSTTASGCASFMASAVCVSCSGGNTSVNSPIAFGVCDDPVRIATPVSWIASWVATLAALPLGVLILGTVSIIPKFVTVCHVTINGYQSLGYPLILTVSIETGERIMTEFLHYRNALGYEEHKAHMGGYTYWIPAVLPLYAAMSNFLAGLFFYLPS